ncbi:MAG TPA: hypothetical protein DCE65_07120, partial [Clostridiales bacterium]|nr:hypothetical protein [Clostridiales bacterium]
GPVFRKKGGLAKAARGKYIVFSPREGYERDVAEIARKTGTTYGKRKNNPRKSAWRRTKKEGGKGK